MSRDTATSCRDRYNARAIALSGPRWRMPIEKPPPMLSAAWAAGDAEGRRQAYAYLVRKVLIEGLEVELGQ
ncbi:hypothetical protein H6F75_00255 [Nodosilinea sp. FACHB-131]|uniref:hypothetical protein n=1 Tax=Cyanophyceae TaxID=3028117 RepID=UPI001686CEFF|nr:hypothetical protein [Nodosilinea sp. FACHB-131]MBD1871901.1 hypothetical protein [Nodosilinea sp. FACHB-131]